MRHIALLLIALLAPAVALAQSPASARLRGVVETIAGNDLSIKQADGTLAAVHLAENFQIAALAKASAADIKPGSFIGAGARPQPDGTLQAVQIVIFPEAMRGTGEGHRAWGALPETTMTNANVAEAVTGVSGPLLTLKYKDGEKKLAIPADAAILALSPAAIADLIAGAQVQLAATKLEEGKFSASRITLICDGLDPL